MSSKEDLIKSKEEDIVKLKKLALLFKNECKKLKEENESLKKELSNKSESSGNTNNEDITSKLKNEYNKRVLIEKSYKKLKEFTVLLEEKIRTQKNESSEKLKGWEVKINELNNELKKSKMESEVLKEKMKEKEITIYKLNGKIEEFRAFLKEKNMNLTIEKKMNEVVAHKVEIKKLRDSLESIKRSEEITAKERQQYKSVLMLCSQYKEKCMKLPKLESQIEVLENQIKELELYKIRDKEKAETIQELQSENLKWNIENNKLREQLNEWSEFSKLYINDKAINIEALKVSMTEIYNKYNTMNLTKTDLEIKYKQLTVDMSKIQQHLEDKQLELKISENKYKQLEKKYEFLKRDYANELTKSKKEESVGTSTATTTNNNTSSPDERMRNEKLVKLATEYKLKYESFKKDNAEKANIIEELNERLEKYRNDAENACLKLKNVDSTCEAKLLLEKEVLYLREEIGNYKNQVKLLENDLLNVTNQWNEDKEKHLLAIKELKESFKKKEMEHKINAATRREVSGASDQTNNSTTSNNHNDISILYKQISDLNTYDEIQISALRNENLYLKSKIEVIKFFYSDQIKNYREAFLYILGWDITIEQNDEEIFFILTSLFATHDGQFVFIKNKCVNEKRNLENQHENVLQLKKMKLEHGLKNDEVGNRKKESVNESVNQEVSNTEIGTGEITNTTIPNNAAQNSDGSEEHKEDALGVNEDDSQFYEELLGEKNMVNTDTIKEKMNFENTNINIPSIMKGCKYNLLLNGYYSIKWQENIAWKNYLNKINTYPIMLSLSCIEEYNHIKSQYNPSLGKNFKGMLFKI